MAITVLDKDARLVRRSLGGDAAAFTELVTRHMPAVTAVARAYTYSSTDADDVVQEAFLKAWLSLDSLQEPRRFGGWVVTIARNVARSQARKAKREAEKRSRFQAEAERLVQVDTTAGDHTMAAMLPDLMEALSEEDRELVYLRYEAEKKTWEVAAILDVPHATVRKRLERVRKKLGDALLASMAPGQAEQARNRRRAAKIASLVVATVPAWRSHGAEAGSAGGAVKVFAAVCTIALLAVPGYRMMQQEFAPVAENAPAAEVIQLATPPSEDAGGAPEAGTLAETPVAVEAAAPNEATPEAAVGGVIAGRIIEEDTGKGAEGLTVRMWPGVAEKFTDAITDGNGRFRFGGLPPGEYNLATGFDEHFKWRYPRNDGRIDNRKIPLAEGELVDDIEYVVFSGLAVRGKVVSPQGNPLANVHLVGWSEPNVNAETTTDQEGRFAFHGFTTDQPAQFWAHHEGFALPPHGPVDIPAEGLDNLVLTMRPESVVEGRLVDQYGKPLGGARLYPWPRGIYSLSKDYSVTTDDAGRFVKRGLHAGSYHFSVYLAGETDSQRLHNLEDFVLAEGEHLRDVELVYEVPGELSISGRVTNDAGAPVANVELRAVRHGVHRTAKSDSAGRYEIQNLGPGTYAVSLDDNRLAWPRFSASEAQAGARDVDIVIDRDGAVHGQVVDAATGAPVEVFAVRFPLQSDRWKNVSDPEGRFEMPSLRPGDLSLWARAEGYAAGGSERFTLAPGEVREGVMIKLDRAGSVAGRVLDSGGKPVRDATVGLDDGTSGGTARTDVEGAFVLSNARVGTWMLQASHPAFAPGETEVTIRAGEETLADVVLVKGASLKGVLSESGVPLSGVDVELNQFLSANVLGYNGRVTTDADGRYRFTGIPNAGLKLRLNPMRNGQGRVIEVPVVFEAPEARTLDVQVYQGTASAVVEATMDDALAQRDGRVWVNLEYHFESGEYEKYYTIAQAGEPLRLEGIRAGQAILSASYLALDFHQGRLAETEFREVMVEEGVDNRFTLTFTAPE